MSPRPAPESTVPPESSLLYRMPPSTRLLLWSTRLPAPFMLLASIALIVTSHHWYIWIFGIFMVAISLLMLVRTRKMLNNLVTRAELDGGDIRFRCWDGRVIAVPRRGRALRKAGSEHPIWITLQVADTKETLAVVKQDKQVTAMLADLDRRGVLRGPGAPRDRMLPPQMMAKR